MNRPPSSFSMLLSRHTRRRAFIAGLASAAAWPLVARGQQGGHRTVGVLFGIAENDPTWVAERKAFADHHRYTAEEAAALLMQVEQQGLELVTTEKDLARMAGEPGLAALRARARPLPVTLALNDEKTLRDLMMSKARL